GHLFRYDLEAQRKTELLIILTPRVIRNEEDAEQIKQIESARISWVLSDVEKMHGVVGLRTRWDSIDCHDVPTIYPDENPRGEWIEEEPKQPAEVLPPPGKVTPLPPGAKPPGVPSKPLPGVPGTRPGPVRPTVPLRPPMSGGAGMPPGAAGSIPVV